MPTFYPFAMKVSGVIGQSTRSLLFRVVMLALVIQAVAVGGAAFWYGHWFVQVEEKAVVERLNRISQLMSSGAVRMSLVANPTEFSLLAGETTLEGMIVSVDGYILSASRQELIGRRTDEVPALRPEWFQNDPAPRVVTTGLDDNQLVIVSPLLFVEAARPNLFLFARLTTTRLAQKVKRIVAFVSLSSLLVFAISAGAIVVLMHRSVTQRVEVVSRVMARITSGDLGARAPEDAPTETMLILQRGINSLAEDVARHRADLEQLVLERTNELIAARERLATIIDVIPDGIVAFNPDRTVAVANPQAQRMLPRLASVLRPGRDLPAVLNAVQYEQGVDPGEIRRWVERLDSEGLVETEMRSGPDDWLRIAARRTETAGIVICATDISQYKKAEHSLERALSKERDLNELQKNFVSMASHQFRTPLAIIDGAAQRIARTFGTATRTDTDGRVQRIRTSVRRLTQLIDNTLNAARMDANELSLRIEPCRISELLSASIQRFEEAFPDWRFEHRLEALSEPIDCDPSLIQEVVDNLIANSIKYARDDHSVELGGRRQGQWLEFWIKDHGIGIDESDLPKLFRRFFRARSSSGIPGTGLGLSVARDIVLLHGGQIQVESTRGSGTLFTVRLPVTSPSKQT